MDVSWQEGYGLDTLRSGCRCLASVGRTLDRWLCDQWSLKPRTHVDSNMTLPVSATEKVPVRPAIGAKVLSTILSHSRPQFCILPFTVGTRNIRVAPQVMIRSLRNYAVEKRIPSRFLISVLERGRDLILSVSCPSFRLFDTSVECYRQWPKEANMSLVARKYSDPAGASRRHLTARLLIFIVLGLLQSSLASRC